MKPTLRRKPATAKPGWIRWGAHTINAQTELHRARGIWHVLSSRGERMRDSKRSLSSNTMRTIAVDFETEYAKDYSVRDLGNYNYTHDPRFNAFMISTHDGTETHVAHPKEFDWEYLRGATLLAHNAGFDSSVYQRLVELDIAPSGLGPWICTANLAAWWCNRRSLEHAATFVLGITPDKSKRAAFKGMTEKQIREAGIWQQTLDYAGEDAVLCWKLWDKLGKLWPPEEQRLAALTIEQAKRGIFIDEPRLREDLQLMKLTEFNLLRRMPWIERGAKPTSPKAVAEECRKVGIPCPPLKKDDEEGADKWVAEHRGQHDWVSAVGELRSLTKVIATYETIINRLKPDGRFDGELIYYGAHTGRWSGAGKVNLQNLRTSPLRIEPEAGRVVEENGHAVDVRALFIPGPGKKFLVADFSQIEARVINWVVGNETFMDAVRSGISPYVAYARQAYGWNGGNELKKVDPQLYKRAKISVLQLGYQSGWKKLQSAALQDGLVFSDAEAEAAVKLFRDSNPGIVGLWNVLGENSKRCVGQEFNVELPNGAMLKYGKIRRLVRKVEYKPKKDADGKVIPPTPADLLKTEVIYAAQVGDRLMKVFGGVLTNNLCQAIARHLLGAAILRIEDAGLKILWTVHDEVIVETDIDTPADNLLGLMRCVPEWAAGCPLDAEVAEMTHYSK
jgi:DNA polymerase I-like protein with 3'-5' exonuclease and polymerase domains